MAVDLIVLSTKHIHFELFIFDRDKDYMSHHKKCSFCSIIIMRLESPF